MLSDLFATPDFLIYDTCTRVLVWSSFWQETLLQEWAVRASWARKPTGPAVVHNGHRPLFTGLKNNLKNLHCYFMSILSSGMSVHHLRNGSWQRRETQLDPLAVDFQMVMKSSWELKPGPLEEHSVLLKRCGF